MTSALPLLIWLQLGGWLRYLARNVRTVKGALLALVGLLVFVPWLLSLALASPAQTGALEPDTLRRTGPAVLILYCVANLIFSTSEKAIYFSPAEINFLFTGPFSRREVLGYKIVLTFLVGLPSTLILCFVVRVRDAWFPAAFAGLLLVSVFLQLFSMTLGLLASSLGASLYTRSRQIVVGLLCATVGFMLYQSGALSGVRSMPQLLDRLTASPVWQGLTLPFVGITETILAQNWFDLIKFFSLGAAVDGALVVLILALDAQYLESSASASARLYARLQRARGRNVSADSEPGSPRTSPRFTLPMFPYLGGVGPIAWRQLTGGLRGLGRVILILTILGTVLVGPLLASDLDNPKAMLLTLIGLGAWMTIFFTALVPFDFRGDIDRLGVLKTLPIPPWRIALGQLIAPTLILSVLQILALGLACLFVSPHPDEDLPHRLDPRELLLACAILAPAVNFVLIAIENLLFLIFPVRLMAATPGDFQALGRNVLLVFAKIIGLGTIGTAAGLLAALAGYVAFTFQGPNALHLDPVGSDFAPLRLSLWVSVATAWLVVAGSGALLVPFIALAFQVFDVGRDTPA